MADYLVFPELERAGRLGNQLHQIASTVGLARAHGMSPLFPPQWSYRPYFSVPEEMFGNAPGLHATIFAEHLDPRTRLYLQDIALWRDVADEIHDLFAPSPKALGILTEHKALGPHWAAFHVRRGDNLVQGEYYPVAPPEWWVAAAEELPKAKPLAIFSDDPDWCETVLGPVLGHRFTVSRTGGPRCKEHEPGYWQGEPTDWIDIFRLAQCGSFVLSNSTYGWWGALLSGSDDVAYQWPYYGPRLDYLSPIGYCDASLMFPSNWRRLPL